MTILQEIVAYKKQLLEVGYYEDKLESLENINLLCKPTLQSALANKNTLAVIAEIKSKSPSVSDLPQRDLHAQVADYTAYGADAISILTDERYFGGSFERLQTLTQETDRPVLCKDFIIDRRQIDVAKRAGASIILLIVNILNDAQLNDLYEYATSLHLEVIVEVHDAHELKRAHALHPKIIGVNNRDLRTFVTDVQHTAQILETREEAIYYISESGMHTVEDVAVAKDAQVSGVLIGEALMRCDDLATFLPQIKAVGQNRGASL